MKKIMIIVLLASTHSVTSRDRQCKPSESTKQITINATYFYETNDKQICYIALTDAEKAEVYTALEPLKKDLLTEKILDKITNATAKQVVQDFVRNKAKERSVSGPMYNTIEDVLRTVLPQGYAQQIGSTSNR